jgi:hypothetical protein
MKLLITESQYKIIIESISILSIKDLSEMICRLGFVNDEDKETWHKILINTYKNYGDYGVIDLFKEATHLNIENISKGKYIFKYK